MKQAGKTSPKRWNFRPFKEARAFVRRLDLKSGEEWSEYCRGDLPRKGTRPSDIPAGASGTYADKGWAGMGDWLGTGTVATANREYRSFKKARTFARSLGLKQRKEWHEFCKGRRPECGTLPSDIPAAPHVVYSNSGWVSVGDWLGTGFVPTARRKYRSFKNARAFARDLGLRTSAEWIAFCKGKLPKIGTLPSDVPRRPDHVYADRGWTGMRDWLGTEG